MRTSKSTHYPIIRVTGAGAGKMTTTNGKSGGAVHYFELGGIDDMIQSIQIAWPDSTSNAAIVLQTTNFLYTNQTRDAYSPYAESDDTSGYIWSTESTSITGPAGSAAGSTMVHLSGMGHRRARLKITVSADTQLYILGHGKQ